MIAREDPILVKCPQCGGLVLRTKFQTHMKLHPSRPTLKERLSQPASQEDEDPFAALKKKT